MVDSTNSLLYGVPDFEMKKLQKIQNFAARTLTGASKYDHITRVFKQLHWLPVLSRTEYKILMLAFRCLHGLVTWASTKWPSKLKIIINHIRAKMSEDRLENFVEISPGQNLSKTFLLSSLVDKFAVLQSITL